MARVVTLTNGAPASYDRLVLAPGIDINWGALPGYNEAASERMPHAWKAGEQTLLLRRQLEAMEDGGTVIISAPANPFRCPPGPYERASLIAYYLKTKKPKSKLIILDAKDAFSKQRLFENAWKELYPGMLEWVSLSAGGKVTSVDASSRTFVTEFGKHKASVANVIPPQKAGRIAERAGVTDRSGWCPVEPVAFESKQQPNIHVIGDAAIMGGCRNPLSRPTPRQRYAQLRSRSCSPAKSRISRSSSMRATASSPRITESPLRASIMPLMGSCGMSKARAASARSMRRARPARSRRGSPMTGSRPSPKKSSGDYRPERGMKMEVPAVRP
jgi:hypothetical protein